MSKLWDLGGQTQRRKNNSSLPKLKINYHPPCKDKVIALLPPGCEGKSIQSEIS